MFLWRNIKTEYILFEKKVSYMELQMLLTQSCMVFLFQSGCLCLDLNETSRYMLCGGSDGLISVWDLKSKKIRKTYKVCLFNISL